MQQVGVVIDVDGAEGHSGGLSWRKMHHTNHRGLKGRLLQSLQAQEKSS
jgi:hypothetical protein